MRNNFQLFSKILDYPGPELAAEVEKCIFQLTSECPEASEALRQFQSSLEEVRLEQLQEIYTSSFDMQPESTLNLGYHLFGEDWRRSIFLSRLSELFQSRSFSIDKELPDHLRLMLLFLGDCEINPEGNELIAEGIIPALSRILVNMEGTSNPYRFALRALKTWLAGKSHVNSQWTARGATTASST